MTPARPIVLIGFMGTGKSAIGQALARTLGRRFVDSDAEIERRAGKSVAAIFAEQGEAQFRRMETALLQEWEGEGELVIATGGGMPLRPENAEALRRIGHVVWLVASPEVVLRRIGPDLSARPLLAGHKADPLARISELLAARQTLYAAAADTAWDAAPFASPEEAAAALAELLCQTVLSKLPKPPA